MSASRCLVGLLSRDGDGEETAQWQRTDRGSPRDLEEASAPDGEAGFEMMELHGLLALVLVTVLILFWVRRRRSSATMPAWNGF